MANIAVGQTGAQDSGQDSDKEKTEKAAKGSRSFSEDAFSNLRHKFGFSVAFNEIYFSDAYSAGSTTSQSAMADVLYPRIYFNLGQRKSKFHLDYGFGYRRYHNGITSHSKEQYGNASYAYQATRKSSFQLYNHFSIAPEWFGSFLSPILTGETPFSGFTNEIFWENQKILRNVAGAQYSYKTAKTDFILMSEYQIWRFHPQIDTNFEGVMAGISYRRQITKWLTLDNSYSAYLNHVDQQYQGTGRIHRLQVGGFRFNLCKDWILTAGGGAEYSKQSGLDQLGELVDVGLGWTNDSSVFTANYHRGFYSGIGLEQIFQSDQGLAGFGTRINSWTNLQLSGSYIRGTGVFRYGSIETYSARAGLDFALPANLYANFAVTYLNQKAKGFDPLIFDRDRYVAMVGIQYVYPGHRR
jgi:hypothetical protein